MPEFFTYGINYPFADSTDGKYLKLSVDADTEIRNNLVHLLLTRKGTRYFLPDFGTRLYEYIFEPMDGPTFSDLEYEIRDSVEQFIPNLVLTNIQITDASQEEENKGTVIVDDKREYVVPGIGIREHTAKIRIDYTVTDSAFNSSDFVIINI